MSNKVSYDFSVDSIVAVDAPIGTDPDTLIEEAKQKLIERIEEGNITFQFLLDAFYLYILVENIFDAETGAYDEDWSNYTR